MGPPVKIGSLCTGYGGLDLAVEQHFNAETVWCAEFDKYASKVIEAHFNIPNYGDIKNVNWAELEPIDILTAGYPCQPFSHAGYRKGTDDERHIFPYILEAIGILKPRWIILENVRGHLTLGLKEVLQGLAQYGYDVRWKVIRASDVGAPHQRARLFIIADSDRYARQKSRRAYRGISGKAGQIIDGSDRQIDRGSGQDDSYAYNQYQSHDWQMQRLGRRFTSRREMHLQASPDALDQSGKLNAYFVEYMMGLPEGWVTNIGLTRAQQLKLLGNGVVPQQAEYALELLTSDWGVYE
jgi:DNA (cytosine-5)-methyltransferase 1